MFIKEIIIKEIKENITTSKFLFLAGGVIVLFMLNAMVSLSDYQERLENYQSIRRAEQKAQKEQCEQFSNVVFHKLRVVKKPSAESFITHAKADKLPNGVKMDFFEISNPQYFKPLDIYSKSFISLDWTNILFYLISFLCLSLSYNALSGEKINRTLQLVLSNQVPRASVITGKFTGLFTLIMIPILIGMIIHIIIYQLSPEIAIEKTRPFIALFFTGMLLFVALNLLTGLLISSLTKQPMVSLSLCLIVWLVFAVVIPGTGWLWSKQMVEIQSVHSIKVRIARKSQELLKMNQYSLKSKSSWKGKAPTEGLLKRIHYKQKEQEIMNRLWHRRIQKQFQQTDHAIEFAKISPYAVFRFFGETISDNGYSGHKHFYHQIQNFHSTYKDFLRNRDQKYEDSYHKFWNESWMAPHWMSSKPINYEALPKFTYERPNFSETLRKAKGNILYLLLWCMVLFAGTFIAFVRYDVR